MLFKKPQEPVGQYQKLIIYVTGVTGEKYLKIKLSARTFPNLENEKHMQMQHAQHTTVRINTKKTMSKHITVKLLTPKIKVKCYVLKGKFILQEIMIQKALTSSEQLRADESGKTSTKC